MWVAAAMPGWFIIFNKKIGFPTCNVHSNSWFTFPSPHEGDRNSFQGVCRRPIKYNRGRLWGEPRGADGENLAFCLASAPILIIHSLPISKGACSLHQIHRFKIVFLNPPCKCPAMYQIHTEMLEIPGCNSLKPGFKESKSVAGLSDDEKPRFPMENPAFGGDHQFNTFTYKCMQWKHWVIVTWDLYFHIKH